MGKFLLPPSQRVQANVMPDIEHLYKQQIIERTQIWTRFASLESSWKDMQFGIIDLHRIVVY